MIKNYVKTAFRSLKKNKSFTAINVLGLSVGLATFLLIVFYVVDELNYDHYNTKAERIYRINLDVNLGGSLASYAAVASPMAATLQSDLPEVEKAVRLRQAAFSLPGKFYFKKGNENIQENNLVFAGSKLFDVFTLPMVEGDPSTALSEPHSVVITKSTAMKYFNQIDVIGRSLLLNDTSNYKITGVIKDIVKQSHFNYDFFLSVSTLPESRDQSWNGGGWNTYILLRSGTNYKKAEADISKIFLKHLPPMPPGSYVKTNLSPLLDIHLRSDRQQELGRNGTIQYVYIFSAIAIFILLIACINFMNLSTACSSNRAKEVGVRKVLGSSRKHLIAQFLIESILVTLVSTLIAILLVWILMPLFNQMSGKELSYTMKALIWLIPTLLVIVAVIGLLAGSYPAFFLSSFQPIDVLKGKISAGFKGGRLRSFLVVFQFSISVFLIIGTLVIYNQLNYILNKKLGYDRSQVLVIKNVSVLGNQAKILKQEIKQLPGVLNATLSSYLPTGEERSMTALFPDQVIDIKKIMLTGFWPVDEDYIKTLGIQLIAGRNFSNQMATDSSAIIVNEAFVKQLNVKDPLNRIVYRASYGVQPFHIIGVMKDFNFSSLRDKISPLVLVNSPDNGALSVKIHTSSMTDLISRIENKLKDLSPNQQFAYSFMDADFDATYRSERRIGTIFISFSTLAIVIACLGLFGLAAYAAQQRSKEIGIRKVLGAGVSTIVSMLSMNFIKLVFISILIASPIAWFVMNKWLEGFAYRINIQWWIMLIAGAVAVVITCITISFQSLKAALANPVKSLRGE